MTVEWAFDRYSFGRPLASYQALKHRFADMYMLARVEPRHRATPPAPPWLRVTPDAAELVSAAKAYIGQYGAELVQDCAQMHGGIGVTFEHDLHLFLRRVTVNRALAGTPADHLQRIAAFVDAREGRRLSAVTDHVGLIGAEQHERAGDQCVALADGDRAAGHGTPAVHAIDRNFERHVGAGAPGEDGVDRLDRLPLLAGQPRHHGLRQQLPAEDDAVRGAEAVRPVTVGTDLLERQRLDERSNREHDPPLGPGGHHCCITGPAVLGPASGMRSRRAPRGGRPDHTVVFDGDVKVRYPPERGFPGTSLRHSVSLPAPPAVVPWVIRTTRG